MGSRTFAKMYNSIIYIRDGKSVVVWSLDWLHAVAND